MQAPAVQSPRASAPYGRACMSCARAKTKCLLNPEAGVKCERCLRLDKVCTPSSGVRKRNVVKMPTASRVVHLEEKLEGVLNLLKHSGQGGSGVLSPAESHTTTVQGGLEELQTRSQTREPSSSYNAFTPPFTQVASGSASITHPSPQEHHLYEIEPSPREADIYLHSFRTNFAKQFPFIVISDFVTAQELRRERPFLWLCIMTTCAKSVSQQRALETEMRLLLGRRILVEGERNMDLLMGILTYVAWGQFYLYLKPVLNSVLQIGISTLYDLGLTKPPPTEPTLLQRCNPQISLSKFQPPPRSMEERRALVGFFVLSSCIAAGLQKIDALRPSPYLDECLQMVTEDPVNPIEPSWYYMVKFRIHVDRLSPASLNEGQIHNPLSCNPPIMYLKALQSQLGDLQSRIPVDLQDDASLLLHTYSAQISISEMALPRTGKILPDGDVQRLDLLWNCLKAVKAWFDTYLAIPTALNLYLPSTMSFQMGQALITAVRLLAVDDRNWDRKTVDDELNLGVVLDQLMAKMGAAREAAGLEPSDDDVFGHHIHKMEIFKSVWLAQRPAGAGERAEGQGIAMDAIMPDLSLTLADDSWLNEILGQWNIPSSSYLP